MAFWLRAGLVIGAIYYLSPLRLGEAPSPARTAQAEAPGSTAGPVVAALSDSLRVRMVEAAAAEAGRSIGGDCRPPWRRRAARRPGTP